MREQVRERRGTVREGEGEIRRDRETETDMYIHSNTVALLQQHKEMVVYMYH